MSAISDIKDIGYLAAFAALGYGAYRLYKQIPKGSDATDPSKWFDFGKDLFKQGSPAYQIADKTGLVDSTLDFVNDVSTGDARGTFVGITERTGPAGYIAAKTGFADVIADTSEELFTSSADLTDAQAGRNKSGGGTKFYNKSNLAKTTAGRS